MRGMTLLALVALAPAGANAAEWAVPPMIVSLCGGDGVTRLAALPLPQPATPRDDGERQRCPKGCHAGASRKREFRPIRA